MKIAIIGAGPAGIMAGINILENTQNEVVFFDMRSPLSTLLPTGGGRCNLGYAEFDNSELVKFYPRGSKFLLSVFSRFSTGDTIEFFEKIGVKTYIQEDLRIFPESNSSKEVRKALLTKLNGKKTRFLKEKVIALSKNENRFVITTDNDTYYADKVIFAGGIKNNSHILTQAGIKIVEPKPALCALCTEAKGIYELSGVTLKNVCADIDKQNKLFGDLLITHKSLSGPLAYKISSLCAYRDFPYTVNLNFVNETFEEFDKYLIKLLAEKSKKDFVNILSDFVPHSFALYLLKTQGVLPQIKASQVDKKLRSKCSKHLTSFPLKVISQIADGEIVTAGGVNTDYINPKTMEYKNIEGLYFCGEALNIDGYTGGFNLQNCWSTGFIAGKALS